MLSSNDWLNIKHSIADRGFHRAFQTLEHWKKPMESTKRKASARLANAAKKHDLANQK
jgi:hypothetical protein